MKKARYSGGRSVVASVLSKIVIYLYYYFFWKIILKEL